MSKEWLRPRTAAQYSDVSLRTINQWFTIGLKRVRVRGVTLIKKAWLDDFIEGFAGADPQAEVDAIVDDISNEFGI